MTPSRWSTVLRRVTTEGPYINERMSVLVLTVVVLAGVSAVAYADKSVAPISLAPLYFLPLALSALVHPLRISLALSIVCLVLHDLVGSVRDVGTEHLLKLKDAITLLGYVFVVVVVNQLGAQRRRLWLGTFAPRSQNRGPVEWNEAGCPVAPRQPSVTEDFRGSLLASEMRESCICLLCWQGDVPA